MALEAFLVAPGVLPTRRRRAPKRTPVLLSTRTLTAPHPPADPLYAAAKRAEARGSYVAAEKLYTALLAHHPDHGKAWSRLVNCVLRGQQRPVERARVVLRNGITSLPTNVILWQKWADLEKGLGNYEVARRLFARSEQANAYLPALYSSWGRMEMDAGNADAARAHFTRGLRRCRSPISVRLLQDMALLESRQGELPRARKLLERAIALEPRNAYAYHSLAVVDYKEGRFAEARENLETAVAWQPGHTLSWLTRAQMEEMRGHVDMARKIYRRALGLDSTTEGRQSAVQLWQAWARMEEKAGRGADAVWIYKRALAAHPSDAMLYCNFGDLQAARGEVASARKLFAQGLKKDSSCALLYQRAAALEVSQGDTAAAKALYRSGVQAASYPRAKRTRQQREAVGHLVHTWAMFEWRRGRIAKSRSLFERAVKQLPSSGWIWMWFGHFEYATTKDGALARHYFSKSINADPKSGQPWRAMADLERDLGNEHRARFCFRRACYLDSSRQLADIDPSRPLARPTRYSYEGPTSPDLITKPRRNIRR